MNARAVPLSELDDTESANERFKRSFDSWLWSSLIIATVLHFCLFSFWPSMTPMDLSFTAAELEAITLPPEIEIPAAPEQIARPATPVISDADIDPDVTIAPTTFEDNPVERLSLPEPAEDSGTGELSEAPAFTPYTMAPVLTNRDEVGRALEAAYPKLLRDANVGGTVGVHVFIDAEGRVQNSVIAKSSGYAQFDEVALDLAYKMKFSPALNRDKKVPVWISIPVIFKIR